MKKIILIIIIGLYSIVGYNQVLKLNAYGFTIAKIYESVPPMKPVDILISINKSRFIIYSKDKQIYDAISSKTTYNKDQEWISYKCIDNDGETINLSYHIMENGDCLIAIDNNIFVWSYLCKFLE